MKKHFRILTVIFFGLFVILGRTIADDNKDTFLVDMPYDAEYLLLNDDFTQKLSYDDVQCLTLMGDDYVIAGTSCGLVIWNIKKSTYQILPIEKNWTPENVEKEYFSDKETFQPGSKKGLTYFQSKTLNTVKNIYVISDGRIWADTLNGSAIFKNNKLENCFNSDEEAIAKQYETVITNKTIWRDWLVAKSGNIFHRHKPKASLAYREIGRQFDGKKWQSIFVDDKMETMLYDWYLDRDGMVWAKVWPELLRFNGTTWDKMQASNPIAFYQAKNGKVWVGCMEGVAEFDSNTNKWHDNLGYISQIIETKDGKLWFFGKGCATSWDGKEWKKVSFASPYNDLNASSAFCLSDNSILLSDFSNSLLKFDGQQIIPVPQGQGLSIKSCFSASSGDTWFILWDGIALIKDNKIDTLKESEKPGQYLCRQVLEGKDKSIWIASQSGIWQFSNNKWKRFSVSQNKPEAQKDPFQEYMNNLTARAMVGNYNKIKDMKEQELNDFLTKGTLNSPGEFVVAYLRLKKTNEKMAIDACCEGLARVLNGKMKGFSSSEGQMWIGLCGRDFMHPLIKLLETSKNDQIRFMGANYISACLTKEDSDIIVNLLQHDNLKDSPRARLSLAQSLFYNKDIRGVKYLVALLQTSGEKSAAIQRNAFESLSLLDSCNKDVPTKPDYTLWDAWLQKNYNTINLKDVDFGGKESLSLFKNLSKSFMDFCYNQAK